MCTLVFGCITFLRYRFKAIESCIRTISSKLHKENHQNIFDNAVMFLHLSQFPNIFVISNPCYGKVRKCTACMHETSTAIHLSYNFFLVAT